MIKIVHVATVGFLLVAAGVFGEADAPAYRVNSLEDISGNENVALRPAETDRKRAPTPLLRGVMVSGGLTDDDGWNTLADWGVALVRFQMGGEATAPASNHEAYAAEWRTRFTRSVDCLEKALVQARKRGIKVCIDQHSWPGGRCFKEKGDPAEWDRDSRMFHDPFYADLLVESWTNLVRRVMPYRDVIYGYDIANEPQQDHPAAPGCDEVSVIKRAALAIRAIDGDTPIVVEAWKDDPKTLSKYMETELGPLIYSPHIYQPHDFTHQGILTPRNCVEYWPDPSKRWDINFLKRWLAQFKELERQTGVKIYIGEFGAIAWAPNAETYLRDCIALFEGYGWDWTYHAFREYPGWSVERESVSRGRGEENYRKSASNPRMRVLKRGLAGRIAPQESGAPCRTRTFRRVMFCGNSLTRHGPNANIGWTNDWGMAASVPERDYVHLLVRALEARSGVRPEFTLQGLPLEKGFEDAEKRSAAIDKAIEWHPDLVVLAYGENAHSVTNDANEALCRVAYLETTRALRDAGAEVVLRAPFWPSERFRRILSGVAEETGAIYVDIGDLGRRDEMTAKGLFKHDGVAAHPGDAGMIAIADRILAAIVEHF